MAFKFELGSYLGRPNFILVSKKGIIWQNLPYSIRDHLKLAHVKPATVDEVSLGRDGFFYLSCHTVGGNAYHFTTSPGLWNLVNEKWEGRYIKQLEFGAGDTYWGIMGDKTSSTTFQKNIPQDFIDAVKKLDDAGQIATWQDVDFAALGFKDAWIFGLKGQTYWGQALIEHYPALIAKLSGGENAGGVAVKKVRNVELGITQGNSFWVEYYDSTVEYQLPKEWHAQINEYAAYQHALNAGSSGTQGSSNSNQKWQDINQGINAANQAAGFASNLQSVGALGACNVM